MSKTISLFIDGAWCAASDGGTFVVENPATGEPLWSASQASADDTRRAIESATNAFPTWRSTDPWRRSAALRHVAARLRERLDEIARTITLETGKPLRQAAGEVGTAADYFDWFADEARRIRGEVLQPRSPDTRLIVEKHAVGVAAVLTSWNFPVNLPARKIAAALAAGCPVICRPSEEAPASTALLFACMEQTDLPSGVAHLLLGRHEPIVPTLMAAPHVRKISFTGSTAVGRELMRASADTIKKVSLELGGHAAAIVFDDADIGKAAGELVDFKFRNAGQICISPSRFYVQDGAYDAFVETARAAVAKLRVGDGMLADTDVGPLINRRRLEAVEALVDGAVHDGARVLHGGARPKDRNRGWFYEPTMLTDVPELTPLMREEPFGPVLPIRRFASRNEVIAQVNELEYGLANYVYTSSMTTAYAMVENLESGMVAVNSAQVATVEAPFGGAKQSGYGSEGGSMGIDEYLTVKFAKIVLPNPV